MRKQKESMVLKMNRPEQKERLQDIISEIDTALDTCRDKKEDFEHVLTKFDELNDLILDVNDVSGVDVDGLKEEFKNEFFSEVLDQPHDALYDFYEDIGYAVSELSERRAEALEERYDMLDDYIERLTQESSEYETIDDLMDNLEYVKNELKNLRK